MYMQVELLVDKNPLNWQKAESSEGENSCVKE